MFVASPASWLPPPSVSSRTVPKRWTAGFSYFIATSFIRECGRPQCTPYHRFAHGPYCRLRQRCAAPNPCDDGFVTREL